MKNLDRSLSSLVSGILVLLLIVSTLNSCVKSTYEQGNEGYGEAKISSGLNEFNPAEISILAGQTVTWINGNANTITVTSNDGMFDGILRTNESYSYMFVSTGTYSYYNRVNPKMVGKIIVK